MVVEFVILRVLPAMNAVLDTRECQRMNANCAQMQLRDVTFVLRRRPFACTVDLPWFLRTMGHVETVQITFVAVFCVHRPRMIVWRARVAMFDQEMVHALNAMMAYCTVSDALPLHLNV